MPKPGLSKPTAPADAHTAGTQTTPMVVELAGLRRRLASMLYETLLLLGLFGLCFMLPYVFIGALSDWVPPGEWAWLHLYTVFGVYFLWYWRHGGQTLAMQTWRLKLVDLETGKDVALGQGLMRYTLSWLSVFSGVGLLWALVDRDRQFLHDRLAHTRIVLLPPLPSRKKEADEKQGHSG
jgi:uncharacterized RDD family membrane protein YckC